MAESGASLDVTRIVRAVVVLGMGAVLLWLSVGVTMSMTIASERPDLTLAWWPFSGAARTAKVAPSLLAPKAASAADLRVARATLYEAVRRNPMDVSALRSIAAIDEFEGHKDRARQLFTLAETISRRDVITELWLIEDSVNRDDLTGAILHYNRVLQTSKELRPKLLPIIAHAAGDPNVRKQLMPLIAGHTRWWLDYMKVLADTGDSPDAIFASLEAASLDLGDTEQRGIAERLLLRLVKLQAYGAAGRAAAMMMPASSGKAELLRDGTFDEADGLQPFAWWMRDEGALRAYQDSVPRGSLGLWFVANAGQSGEVAHQLLVLTAGSYRLTGVAGGVASGQLAQPSIRIDCARDDRSLGSFQLPPSDDEGKDFQFVFSVPAEGCDAQWIRISTAPAVDTQAWVDDLQIARVAGSVRR